eukprot:Colp12_sorted_trinity150504_noHs@30360
MDMDKMVTTTVDPTNGIQRSASEIETSAEDFSQSEIEISHLPSEVLALIFSYATAKDLATCSRVCAHWRNVIRHFNTLFKFPVTIKWLHAYTDAEISRTSEDKSGPACLPCEDGQCKHSHPVAAVEIEYPKGPSVLLSIAPGTQCEYSWLIFTDKTVIRFRTEKQEHGFLVKQNGRSVIGEGPYFSEHVARTIWQGAHRARWVKKVRVRSNTPTFPELQEVYEQALILLRESASTQKLPLPANKILFARNVRWLIERADCRRRYLGKKRSNYIPDASQLQHMDNFFTSKMFYQTPTLWLNRTTETVLAYGKAIMDKTAEHKKKILDSFAKSKMRRVQHNGEILIACREGEFSQELTLSHERSLTIKQIATITNTPINRIPDSLHTFGHSVVRDQQTMLLKEISKACELAQEAMQKALFSKQKCEEALSSLETAVKELLAKFKAEVLRVMLTRFSLLDPLFNITHALVVIPKEPPETTWPYWPSDLWPRIFDEMSDALRMLRPGLLTDICFPPITVLERARVCETRHSNRYPANPKMLESAFKDVTRLLEVGEWTQKLICVYFKRIWRIQCLNGFLIIFVVSLSLFLLA